MKANWLPIIIVLVISMVIINNSISWHQERQAASKFIANYMAAETIDTVWRGWNKYQIKTSTDSGKLIWYGHELIANTAYYFGPKGIIAHTTNGMNCQNCHLDGGTVPYGNNFGKVYATYPQFRARNNGVQSIYARVNDCFERSLNGKPLDSTSKEMQAIYAYIQWLGSDVPKGVVHGGTSIAKLKYLSVAANPIAGKAVYIANCQTCHGNNGQGQLDSNGIVYKYPPLWGEYSFNDGAGLYRIGSFAGFVKNNMPFGTDYHEPKLTDKEAWDVAAFVNSQPRPHKNQTADWKNMAKKPIDFPFGPYIDTFTQQQHKYGPFAPIKNANLTFVK